jgi:hypothetical protein
MNLIGSKLSIPKEYIASVLDGITPACEFIRQACERQVADLADPDFAYRFDLIAVRLAKFETQPRGRLGVAPDWMPGYRIMTCAESGGRSARCRGYSNGSTRKLTGQRFTRRLVE